MSKKGNHRITITDRAYNILKGLVAQEPECKSTYSDMIELLYDGFCEEYGTPDTEIG